MNDALSQALREVTVQVINVQDSEELREVVIAINQILDTIERQLAKLQGNEPREQ